MKFAKYLESEAIPEWRKAYINYKGLKKWLKAISEAQETSKRIKAQRSPSYGSIVCNGKPISVPQQAAGQESRSHTPFGRSSSMKRLMRRKSDLRESDESSDDPTHGGQSLDTIISKRGSAERAFFRMLDAELSKVSRFYQDHLNEAKAKLEVIREQVKLVEKFKDQMRSNMILDEEAHPELRKAFGWIQRRYPPAFAYGNNNHQMYGATSSDDDMELVHARQMSYKEARSRIRKACAEFYRSLEMLKNFRVLNKTGFTKILKKFDKTAGWNASRLYMENVRSEEFAKDEELEGLIQDTESLYIQHFADGKRNIGMRKLRVPEQQDQHYHFAVLRIGMMLGLSVPALVAVLYAIFHQPSIFQNEIILQSFLIYASIFLPIAFALAFSLNILAWARFRINYKFIFEFNPRDTLNYRQFAEIPAFMMLVLLYGMWAQITNVFNMSIEYYPLLIFLILSAILFCPFDIFHFSARRWFLEAMEKVHLWNAGKYVSSIGAMLAFGPNRIYGTFVARIVYIILCTINSLYTSAWDLRMDWGLLHVQCKHPYLRDQTIYPQWCYYVAMPVNVLLRFGWIVNVIPVLWLDYRLPYFVSAALEAYRRWQWNFIRMENEHLNNEIPLPFDVSRQIESTEDSATPSSSQTRPLARTPTGTSTYFGRRDFENRPDDPHERKNAGILSKFRATDSDDEDEDTTDHLE
ncbi:hypothetical protein BZG36_04689 [Bifiguratus adelaidae]|uniref:SPX domain-containing protein n=1 Tax=Bifiguratus adelaidae TaxID=1938954 RepID=A0A261XUF6_9FUNG|nr:hypothetical protein BZG36_04689 [Bifiguratus adelaidae]